MALPVVLPFIDAPVVVLVAAGPPACELPPAVLPDDCARAKELVAARTAAKAIVVNFIGRFLSVCVSKINPRRQFGSDRPRLQGNFTRGYYHGRFKDLHGVWLPFDWQRNAARRITGRDHDSAQVRHDPLSLRCQTGRSAKMIWPGSRGRKYPFRSHRARGRLWSRFR